MRRLRRERRAVTAMEYALIGALVAITIAAGAGVIGTSLTTTFNKVSSEL